MAEHRLQRTRDAYADEGIPDTHWYNAPIRPVVRRPARVTDLKRPWIAGDMTPSDLASLLAGDV